MRRLVAPADSRAYTYDVMRLVKVANEHGYSVSQRDAQWAWEEHSDSMAAGWLILPESDYEILNALKEYLSEVDE